MKRSKATVGPSYVTDIKAQRYFESWLPTDWLLRKDNPDFHLDYVVEPVQDGEPTGVRFGVQLKGHETFRKGKGPVGHSFKTKHLMYYLRCQIPVFLVVVDAASGQCRWLFAQHHLSQNIKSDKLKRQQNLKLFFPPEQNFEDFKEFDRKLAEAVQFVQNLFPGSIAAAVNKRRQELEDKDSRVEVRISVQDRRELITLIPKEKLPLHVTLRAPNRHELSERIRLLIDHGEKLSLRVADVELSGSPLIEHLWNAKGDGTIHLQFGRKLEGEFLLILHGPTPHVFHFTGNIQVGRKLAVFKGGWPGSPVRLEFSLPLTEQPGAAGLRIDFELNAWLGQLVSELKFFDVVKELMAMSNCSVRMELQLSTNGNRVCARNNPAFVLIFEPELLAVFQWICKLRQLCAHYRKKILLPDLQSISEEDWSVVEALTDLIEGKELREKCPDLTLVATGNDPGRCDDTGNFKGIVRFITDSMPASFLGIVVDVGPIEQFYTEVEATVATLPTGGRSLSFRTTQRSERVISLAKRDENTKRER